MKHKSQNLVNVNPVSIYLRHMRGRNYLLLQPYLFSKCPLLKMRRKTHLYVYLTIPFGLFINSSLFYLHLFIFVVLQ